MNDITARFLMQYTAKLMEIREIFRREDWSCVVEEHDDYFTLDMKFEYCNSKYADCIVFYTDDEHSFDEGDFWSDFDNIITKARTITK